MNKCAKPTDSELLHYFRVSRPPRQAGPGDKAFVLVGNRIIGYHIIQEIRYVGQSEADELSGGDWQEGFYIIRKADSWTPFDLPIAYDKTRGQWTWRYG